MINQLDKTIEAILIDEGGFERGVVDIHFETPNREWAARISAPTLNCYLFDIRENVEMRQQGRQIEPQDPGSAVRRQPALWFDLTYLITAWTQAIEDEHLLLWQALLALARYRALPTERLPEALQQRATPIYASVARPDNVLKSPGEIWSALENQLKPSLSYTLTLSIEREKLLQVAPVSSVLLGLQQAKQINGRAAARDTPALRRMWFGGVVRDSAGQVVPGALVRVEQVGIQAVSDDDGQYRLGSLAPGSYVLVASYAGAVERRSIALASQPAAGDSSSAFDIQFHQRWEGSAHSQPP